MSYTSPAEIDRVDAFTKRLFKRARTLGADFEDVSMVLRSLHTVLKHLKAESEDPESLLNVDDKTVYSRQLTPIIEDCEFTLKQFDCFLEKSVSTASGSDGEGSANGRCTAMDGEMGWTMETLEREKINLMRTKLANQKLNIDMFLDTVQLHNPAKQPKVVDTTSASLDSIKDKVDAVAARVCHPESPTHGEDDDELWQQFRDELEKEGFSKDVLRKNQDVLRAYIRQLDEQAETRGVMPSVRGFLEGYPTQDPTRQLSQRPASDLSPKTTFPEDDNDSVYSDRQLHMSQETTSVSSYDRQSVDDEDSACESAALISTRDLMALDKRDTDLAIAMGDMHINPSARALGANYSVAGSPPRSLPPSASQPALLGSPEVASSPDHSSVAPRYTPSLTRQYSGSPPPTLRSNSISAPAIPGQQQLTPAHVAAIQRAARLAPDSQGREIPLDAKWTRIRRSLISTEVLTQAGVRYEARPEYVAILGALTKEEVIEFARRSAEIRNSRKAAAAASKKERRPEDRYHPDKYRNWEVNPVNPNGYVVNPKDTRRRGSQFSSSSELFDSSDDEASSTDSLEDIDEEEEDDSNEDESQDETPVPLQSQSMPYSHNFTEKYEELKRNRARVDSGVSNVSLSSGGTTNSDDEKGTKVYPFVVQSPVKEDPSPAATSKPKPILKNKVDETHVRFDPEPQVLDETARSDSVPRSLSRRDSYRGREREREREREKRYRSDRYGDKERERERERYPDHHIHTERRRDRERERSGREDSYPRRDDSYPRRTPSVSNSSTSSRPHGGLSRRDSGDATARRRDERDRPGRKRARSDALRSVGIGGAAASLLGVLTEAAVGF